MKAARKTVKATKPPAIPPAPPSWEVVGDALMDLNRASDELVAHGSDLSTIEMAIRGLEDNDPEDIAFSAQRLGYRLADTLKKIEAATDKLRGEYHATEEHALKMARLAAETTGAKDGAS